MFKSIAFIVMLSSLIALNNNDPVTMGDQHLSRNELNEAIFYYSQAIEEKPSAAILYFKRARAYLYANRYEEYYHDIQKVIQLDPDLPSKLSDSMLTLDKPSDNEMD